MGKNGSRSSTSGLWLSPAGVPIAGTALGGVAEPQHVGYASGGAGFEFWVKLPQRASLWGTEGLVQQLVV